MFEQLNDLILRNPELLQHMLWLIEVKRCLFLLISGFFLYLVYFGDEESPGRRKRAAPKKRENRFIA